MNLTKTSDVKNLNIYALIVGQSGGGKTYMARTLPHDKTLIISAESGLLSLKDVSIDVVEVSSFNDVRTTLEYLLSNETKYEHIYIDSLTEIGEMLFAELKPNYENKKIFHLYSDYSDRVTKMLKLLRDMPKYHIWMTALDKVEQRDFDKATITIDLVQKSLAKKLPPLFDEVFYMIKEKREDGTTVRALCTDSDDVEFTKDRSGSLNKFEQPDLGTITKKILGE